MEKNNPELPSISVIIPTLNSARTIKNCLESIRNQSYNQEIIEILIIDGGSEDGTKAAAEEFWAAVIEENGKRNQPEARKAVGLARAKGEFVIFIDSDNILPHKEWLKRMLVPVLENSEITAVQPLRYHYDKSFSPLNRYFALFGVNDPIAYYFNKRDRLSWAETKWRMKGKAEDKGGYYYACFQKDALPTLGANGFLARREILKKARVSPEEFFHIDVNYDLVALGYDKYGIIKDTIIHLSADNLFSFLRKRLRFMEEYHQKEYGVRRYRLYEPKDKFRLIVFILFSLTFVKPLYDSIKGFIKVPDFAWFMHPLMCFLITVTYGYATIGKLAAARE